MSVGQCEIPAAFAQRAIPAAMLRLRPTTVSNALGIAILQLADRNTADPGHEAAGDIGIKVLIEHPENLAAPPHARDQIPAAMQPMGHDMSRKAVGLRNMLTRVDGAHAAWRSRCGPAARTPLAFRCGFGVVGPGAGGGEDAASRGRQE